MIKKIADKTEYSADNLGDLKPKIVIGGKTEKFVPNINHSFEYESGKELFYLNVNRKSVTVSDEKEKDTNGKVGLTIGKETDVWHTDENGILKWDIEFSEKPERNVFEWQLKYTDGLHFHYQGELSEEEKSMGAIRPDNVIGSYAVYCNKADNHINRETGEVVNYRTGKLCHIYRPFCTDADGKTTWAELHIENDVMSITIPQEFLNNAKYPVTLDPDFGYTTVGGSSIQLASARANILSGTRHTGVTGDEITQFSIHQGNDGYYDIAAYTVESDVPVTRLAAGVQVTAGASAAWCNSATVEQVLTNGTVYCLAMGDTTVGAAVSYDAISGGRSADDSTGDLPATWTHTGYGDFQFSMYATYTESAGGWSISVLGQTDPATVAGVANASIGSVLGKTV